MDAVSIIQSADRAATRRLMTLNGIIDCLIPRGGAGLIRAVVDGATVPVIETGTGNCHVYIDKGADPAVAVSILVNAKVQRPSVCNSAETIVWKSEPTTGFEASSTDASKQRKTTGSENTTL
jgi:glutamate-5-semialdehyde dehydrogenase